MQYLENYSTISISNNIAARQSDIVLKEVQPIYEDETDTIDWASSTFDSYTITSNEIEYDSPGDESATSDPYTAVIGEIIQPVEIKW